MEQLYIMLFMLMLFASTMTIMSNNPIHSMFWMVLMFINSAGVLLVLKLEFLSFILMMIYMGAITILFLFVMMMLDIINFEEKQKLWNFLPIMVSTCSMLMFQFWLIASEEKINLMLMNSYNNWNFEEMNNMTALGLLLYNSYANLLVILSLTLLIGLFGAMILTLENNEMTKKTMFN